MVPNGSIYFWCYSQGLRKRDWADVQAELLEAGREIRQKDERNFWNGWYNSALSSPSFSQPIVRRDVAAEATGKKWSDYPRHPFIGIPEPEARFVPCNADNRPMIKWGAGCMLREDAEALRHQVYLGENMLMQQRIVFDCDGDHDPAGLDYQAIEFWSGFIGRTHAMAKPKRVCDYGPVPEEWSHLADLPASFHITFSVDRLVPTMHFPHAHTDVVGNAGNSLRYFKNKLWNGLAPIPMDDATWDEIMSWIRSRDVK